MSTVRSHHRHHERELVERSRHGFMLSIRKHHGTVRFELTRHQAQELEQRLAAALRAESLGVEEDDERWLDPQIM